MPVRFALNHMAAPGRDVFALFDLARRLGMTAVEIRNDLPRVAIEDGTPPAILREAARQEGVEILSINALRRFNQWTDGRAAEATRLCGYAAACGARALVMCPVNSTDDSRGENERVDDLRTSLAMLRPLLAAHGLIGLAEPLGFAASSLRFKRTAIEAIDKVGGGDVLRVLHDTFHHFLSGETEVFPTRTGLAHISGVEDRSLAHDQIRDRHRVLVGAADRLDNVGQIAALLHGGYAGPMSFEPFSATVHDVPDVEGALRDSMAFIRDNAALAAA